MKTTCTPVIADSNDCSAQSVDSANPHLNAEKSDLMRILEQYMHHVVPKGISISSNTLKDTHRLFEMPLYASQLVQSKQDEQLARMLSEASAVALPANVKHGEFIATPLDIMAYKKADTDDLGFTCLEFNTIGYGGIFALPRYALDRVQTTLGELGRRLSEEKSPLILVSTAGRQNVLDPSRPDRKKPNVTIHEKVWIADKIADGIRNRHGADSAEVLSFDTPDQFAKWVHSSSASWESSRSATIVIGYTRDFINSSGMQVIDGVPYLFGRRVACIINDRFIANLQVAHGPVDPEKVIFSNITSRIGTDKMTAYRAVNEYNAGVGANYASCNRLIPASLAEDEDQMVLHIRQMLNSGRRAIIKPRGTGWGHGIETFLDAGESDEEIRMKIRGSVNEVDVHYNHGLRIAGYPYTVTEYLDAATIHSPDPYSTYHYAHGCKFELRIAVYADYSTGSPVLRACPAHAKLQLMQGSKVCNVSHQMLKTGRPKTDFMLPLCSPATLKIMGISEEKMSELCQWSARYVAHVLSNKHAYAV